MESEVHFDRFAWSGRNDAADRRAAGFELLEFLKRQRLQFPDYQQIVIAHSHGGALLSTALMYGDRDVAAVFLATPFIVARVRKDYVVIAGATLMAFLTTLASAITWATAYFFDGYQFGLPLASAIGAVFSVASLTFVFRYYSRDMIERYMHPGSIASDISSAYVPDEGKYLFIRSTGDEAAGVLSFVQFGSWLFSKAISPILACLEAFKLLTPYRELNSHAVSLPVVLSPIIVMLVTAITQEEKGHATMTLLQMALIVFHFMTNLGAVGYCFLAIMLAVALVALLLGLLVAFELISWACHLSFGRSSFATAMFVEIGVEPVPFGTHPLTHVPWHDLDAHVPERSIMSHSAPYQNVHCIYEINKWLRELLKKNSCGFRAIAGPPRLPGPVGVELEKICLGLSQGSESSSALMTRS